MENEHPDNNLADSLRELFQSEGWIEGIEAALSEARKVTARLREERAIEPGKLNEPYTSH